MFKIHLILHKLYRFMLNAFNYIIIIFIIAFLHITFIFSVFAITIMYYSYTISFNDLSKLIHLYHHYSDKIPNKRISICSAMMYDRNAPPIQDMSPTVLLEPLNATKCIVKKPLVFGEKPITKDICCKILKLISSTYPHVLEQFDVYAHCTNKKDDHNTHLKKIILMPTFGFKCCIHCLNPNNELCVSLKSHSNPLIYTKNGTEIGVAYHLKCKSCSATYLYSHCELNSGKHIFYDDCLCPTKKYLLTSRLTGFELEYLYDIKYVNGLSGNSFEVCCNVYNARWHKKKKTLKIYQRRP